MPANILLVDDSEGNLLALEGVLEPLKQRVVKACSGEEALKSLLSETFAVVLLDIHMRGLNGFEVAALMKGREKTRHTPIIFITGTSLDPEFMERGYTEGAVDYLLKPFSPSVLRSKVSVFVDLFVQREELLRQAALLGNRERASLARASDDRFRRLMEAIPECIWGMRPDGTVSYRNKVWVEYSGVAAEDPRSHPETLHPDDRDRGHKALSQALQTGQGFELQYRLRRRDGVYRWFLTRTIPEMDAQGQIVGFISTATDIDEQKFSESRQIFWAEASRLLASSLEYEQTLVTLAQLTVPTLADWCTVDMLEPDGTLRRLAVSHIDPAKVELAHEVWRLWPPKRSDPIGLYQVVESRKSSLLPEITDAMLVAGLPDPEVLALYRKLGLFSSVSVPLIARDRVLGVMSLTSAESRVRFGEREVAEAEELARRAAVAVDNAQLYREAKAAIRLRDEFLAVASHELNTPLTPLSMKLETLTRDAEASNGTMPAEQVLTHVRVAQRQVRRLAALVEGLLDVARLSSGKLSMEIEPLQLREIVAEVVSSLEMSAEKAGCQVDFVADGPGAGEWDRLRLGQLVTNLLSNALKYGAGHPVQLRLEELGAFVRLTVRDEGIGIPAEHLSRIFGRFERAVSDRHYGGLGLGLFICQQIVDALGGTIQVQSHEGRGSTFIVELPVAPRASP